ncbi:methyltransferase domain-containing protein [Shewanella donghaensis]|uniref:methyltransferase domain-containing protein n=1 Tax=Shewanella donghaensis TaxID=238836 RepID=UPI001315A3C8|nr:methyltransferase domain-containing protein [Shewanella donghaensis]
MNLENPVAVKFSQAAATYKQHDVLQRITAGRLMQLASAGDTADVALKGHLLDLGCGPGTDFNINKGRVTKVTAVDLSAEMLKAVQQSFPQYHTICADAASLPIAASSMDCIYSNLVLQWCGDLNQVFSELNRVLTPRSEALISVVSDGSLSELETLGLGHNAFRHLDDIIAAIDTTQWQILFAETTTEQVHFTDLKALLYSIKGVGASVSEYQDKTLAAKNNSRLRGRKDWLALVDKAEKLREANGLPLSYNISYLRLAKR